MSRRRIDAIIEGRDPETFARNVRRARESMGWTRQDLCKKSGVSPQTLAKVEGGQGCTPGVEKKLAAVLGTVVGRLWVPQELPRQLLHQEATDRWYFAGHADGERYHRSQSLTHESEEIRFDPEAIQTEGERARMGWSGLARGFVRVTTAHLAAGTIISSVIEVFGRIESELPDGRLAYFQVARGALRFHIGERTHEAFAGDVLQAEMESPAWIEPHTPIQPGEPPPLLVYVDVQGRVKPAK